MLKIVNFFKSYKVHLLDISTVYKAFDKRENSIKVYEDWILKVKKCPDDYTHIIEEITGDVNITTPDKVKLLEQIYFDIERWEFRDFKDKFEFDLKYQISKLLEELTYEDKVTVTDHYKGWPFAGIEYTHENDDYSTIIEEITPNIEINMKNKFNILDNIKIEYED